MTISGKSINSSNPDDDGKIVKKEIKNHFENSVNIANIANTTKMNEINISYRKVLNELLSKANVEEEKVSPITDKIDLHMGYVYKKVLNELIEKTNSKKKLFQILI